MSDKFQVILADLGSAALTFGIEGDNQDNLLKGPGAPGMVDGGDGAFNAALDAVLTQIVFLNSSLAAWMRQHGSDLMHARDNYKQVDQSMHELFDDLVPEN